MGDEPRRRHGWQRLLALLLLLLLALLVVQLMRERGRAAAPDARDVGNGPDTAAQRSDTLTRTDTLDTAALRQQGDTVSVDTVTSGIARPGTAAPGTAPDGAARGARRDSLTRLDSALQALRFADTLPVDPCSRDTAAPWVYPDPAGGLHYGTVRVRLVSDKACRIEWRIDDTPWRLYEDADIVLEASATLEYRAVDSCGNEMKTRRALYDIGEAPPRPRCPPAMTFVQVGGSAFCIDRYEWPNRKGTRPATFVSLYQAMDSCFSQGKRLCSSDEWKLACSGPYGWRYPYGEHFEPRACVTADSALWPSGSRSECRGYFEVFDMSGNALEWTATRSSANPRFFNVMGGFWESGSQSSCYDARYSYFPQNRHNPVGFRCCADTLALSAPAAEGRGVGRAR